MGNRADLSTASVGAAERRQLLSSLQFTEREIVVADLSTTVQEAGEGTPIVLLHGPAATGIHWMRLMNDLATTHRVLVPDLPGHGATRGRTEHGRGDAFESERMVRWLAELIERVAGAPAILAGHALGGALAARLAIRHPRLVDGLILVDTFGLTALEPPPAFASAIQDFVREPSRRTHDGLWRFCAFDLDSLRQRMGAQWETFATFNVAMAVRPEAAEAVGALMQQFGGAIPPGELSSIAAPTTLVWGRHDLATPLAVAERASARYGWSLHVIEGAADDPLIEQPEALLRALRVALRASPARRSVS